MFFQLIMDFYLMIFDCVYHDNDIDQEIYFNKLFYILNQSAIQHQMIGQDNALEILRGFDENIIEIISCLGICTEMFVILHELAHLYLNHKTDIKDELSQELEADRIAFHILVDLIEEQTNNKTLIFDCFEKYCIIAPIILFEFFKSIHKTSLYKYGKPYIKNTNTLLARKE